MRGKVFTSLMLNCSKHFTRKVPCSHIAIAEHTGTRDGHTLCTNRQGRRGVHFAYASLQLPLYAYLSSSPNRTDLKTMNAGFFRNSLIDKISSTRHEKLRQKMVVSRASTVSVSLSCVFLPFRDRRPAQSQSSYISSCNL